MVSPAPHFQHHCRSIYGLSSWRPCRLGRADVIARVLVELSDQGQVEFVVRVLEGLKTEDAVEAVVQVSQALATMDRPDIVADVRTLEGLPSLPEPAYRLALP